MAASLDSSERCPTRSRQCAGADAATANSEKLLGLEERHLDAYAPRQRRVFPQLHGEADDVGTQRFSQNQAT
jgi:hypothetical protein